MKKQFIFILITTFFAFGCQQEKPSGGNNYNNELVITEPIEWTDIWVEDTDQDSLPRLLLIGDSHVHQYYSYVKEALKGLVTFGRYACSKCLGNPYLQEEIKLFLRQYPADIIVFNNGLHGKAYPDSVYAAAIPGVFRIFQTYAPEARIVWVNTTPVRSKEDPEIFDPFTDHVKIRNRYALQYMKDHGIPVVDVFSLGADHPGYYSSDGVHFNDAGKKAEAHSIAEAVKKILVELSL